MKTPLEKLLPLIHLEIFLDTRFVLDSTADTTGAYVFAFCKDASREIKRIKTLR